MQLMQLKFPKKLFCFELKIGAIITGWLHLILSILGFILMLIILFNHEMFLRARDYFYEVYNETNLEYLELFQDQNEKKYIELALKISVGFYLFVCIVNLAGASFLIYGAMKENHLLLLPWLTSEVLGMFIMLCNMFIRCPYLIIVIIVRVYIWYCIWAFYRDIKRNKQITGYPTEPSVAVAFGNETPPTKPPSYGDVVAFN